MYTKNRQIFTLWMQQECRVESTWKHPKWTGDINYGYDIAVFRLPRPIDVKFPMLVEESEHMYPNRRLYVLKYGKVLEAGLFVVVANAVCPMMQHVHEDDFCLFADDLNVEPGEFLTIATYCFSSEVCCLKDVAWFPCLFLVFSGAWGHGKSRLPRVVEIMNSITKSSGFSIALLVSLSMLRESQECCWGIF